MDKSFNNPFKTGLHLKRYPLRTHELLQAWDSADDLLLGHLSTVELKGKRILLLNDSFGALRLALEAFDVTSYTDSYVSARALELNSDGRLQSIHHLSQLKGPYDLVLIRIPKNMSFFEDELCRLTSHLHAASEVICAYMVKHQANSSFELLGKIIGETRTSLARKKARLIFCSFTRGKISTPYPLSIQCEGFHHPILNHSNLFSREKLDLGTRFFLEHIPTDLGESVVLDLGCGNGLVGIRARALNPKIHLLFNDESSLAVESARANFETFFPASLSESGNGAHAEFHWTNCFEDGKLGSLDFVLCNPPFHQGTTVGDFVAWQMFSDAHRALKPGGRLRVIGNTGLGYPNLLQKIFKQKCDLIAQSAKFTIVEVAR